MEGARINYSIGGAAAVGTLAMTSWRLPTVWYTCDNAIPDRPAEIGKPGPTWALATTPPVERGMN